MFSIRAITLFVAIALLAPLAQAAGVHIRDITGNRQGTVISGLWPSACQPVVAETTLQSTGGRQVVLTDSADRCAPVPHAFSLQLPADRVFAPSARQSGVTPIHVLAQTGDREPVLVGFGLLGGHRDRAPDSGFWWPQGDNDASGNVLSLELQDDTLVIALLSHDNLSGAPVWYFGASPLEDGIAHAELVRLDDGASAFFGMHVKPVPRPGVTIDIAFDSATRARVWLSRPDPVLNGQLQVVPMTFARRSFLAGPPLFHWQGRWLVAHGPGDEQASVDALPAHLDLRALRPERGGMLQLNDRDSGLFLECSFIQPRPERLHQCTLINADGEPLAHFHQIGLQRMDGTDRHGRAIVLLRPR